MRYRTLSDGEWAQAPDGLAKIACCDCHLTHVFQFKRANSGIQYRGWRDNRATAAKRRGKMTPLSLAYIAGFFDGEGSITIHENCKPSPRGKNPNHTLQVSLGNTDPRIVRELYRQFGGTLTKRAPLPNCRPFLQWHLRAAKALPFLLAIRPHLCMKIEQADVAITFQQSKGHRGPAQVAPEVIQWREDQRAEIRRLNARTIV